MIQNTPTVRTRVATYVYLRNGIYYFQLRLKKHDERGALYKSGLIRKSLKTGNYREAIMRARLLWLEYMTDKKTIDDIQGEVDASAQYHENLLERGEVLYKRYSVLEEENKLILNQKKIDQFFDENFGSDGYSYEFDKEAFQYYTDCIVNKSPAQPIQSASANNIEENSTLQSNKSRVRIGNPTQKFCLISSGMGEDIKNDAHEAGIQLALYKRRPEDRKFADYARTIGAYVNDNV